MKIYLFAAMLILGSIGSASATVTGKVFQIWVIGDYDLNTAIRGQVQVDINDQSQEFFIPDTDKHQKDMLATLLSAQAQDRNVSLEFFANGNQNQLYRVTIK